MSPRSQVLLCWWTTMCLYTYVEDTHITHTSVLVPSVCSSAAWVPRSTKLSRITLLAHVWMLRIMGQSRGNGRRVYIYDVQMIYSNYMISNIYFCRRFITIYKCIYTYTYTHALMCIPMQRATFFDTHIQRVDMSRAAWGSCLFMFQAIFASISYGDL